jgi:hypothetical protein
MAFRHGALIRQIGGWHRFPCLGAGEIPAWLT